MFRRYSSTLAMLLAMAFLGAGSDGAWSQPRSLYDQQVRYQTEIQFHLRNIVDTVEQEIRAGNCEYVVSTLRRLSFYLEKGFVTHYEWETGRRWLGGRGPELTEFQEEEITRYARARYERLVRLVKVHCPQTVAAIVSSDPCGPGGSAPTAGTGSSTGVVRYSADDEREHEAWARRLRRDLRAQDTYAQDRQVLIDTRFVECARRSLSVTGEFGVGHFNAQPTDFFIFRNPMTGLERRGIFTPDAGTTFVSGGGSVSFNLPSGAFPFATSGTSFKLFFHKFSGSASTFVGEIDPRGESLGIAGTGDPNAPFPEGVLLGAGVPLGTAGGFNVLRDVYYRRDINAKTFGGEFSAPGYWRYGLYAPGRAGVSVTPHLGLKYTRLEVDEVTRFSIPGFLTEGAYVSNYVNDAFTFYGGARLDVPLKVKPNLAVTSYIQASLGATHNDLEGWDRLDLSGFLNTQQRVGLSADDTSLYLQVSGGVNVAVGNFCLGGSVTYTRDENYANLLRTGQTGQTTQAQFTDSEAIVGRVSARYAFGAPAPVYYDSPSLAGFVMCP
jgi:hypothetical protein